MGQNIVDMILLDSTVLIDLTRENEEAINFIDTVRKSNHETAISIISSMELIIGCRNKSEIGKTLKFLREYSIIDISVPISRKSYQLIIQYSKSHGLVIPDAFIAATALDEGLTLVTSNVRHFDMIEGLGVQKPY
ncbi:MAG: type II toxin-antitoxin system VapC family toxin [Thermodesulfobacteriota bacterium]|nr:type II toxin-antitoxin system VapC family toxin [Thermodesulfobacteriota bacterium]